jgi:protein SCO1/2
MKFKSILLLFIICVSCKKNAIVDKTKTLPFYNSEEFAPKWIAESAASYSEIHTISPLEFTNQNGQK